MTIRGEYSVEQCLVVLQVGCEVVEAAHEDKRLWMKRVSSQGNQDIAGGTRDKG